MLPLARGSLGSASFAISTISFDSNASTYALNGTAAAQSAIFEKFSDGSHHGIHAQHYPVSDSGSYSNTDTTLTLNGHTDDVVYGRVVNGTAEGFTALYQGQKGDTCVIHLLAQTQQLGEAHRLALSHAWRRKMKLARMPEIATTDIWRAANVVIQLYGEDAAVRTAMRADALLEQGDTEGFFVWKRIVRAIDDLSQTNRRPDEQEH